MAVSVTEGDLLVALAAALPKNATAPENARTIREMAQVTGQSRDVIETIIGRLAMQGRIAVHYVTRPDLTGRMQRRPAYTILPPKKGK